MSPDLYQTLFFSFCPREGLQSGERLTACSRSGQGVEAVRQPSADPEAGAGAEVTEAGQDSRVSPHPPGAEVQVPGQDDQCRGQDLWGHRG